MNQHESTQSHDCNMCQHVTSLILSLPSACISMSSNIDKLAIALIKATGDMGFIKKDKGGAERAGKKIYYADINAVLEESKPHLKLHGLSLLQPIFSDEHGAHRMGNILLHESGQFISSSMIMEKNQQNMQQFGGDITYMRRYSCVSMLGIAQEDNDGQQAVQVTNNKPQFATNEQVKKLMQYTNASKELTNVIHKQYGIFHISELKESDAAKLIAQLSK